MEDLNVNYNGKQIRSHKVMLTNRKTCTISGVVDVLSFDTGEVLLETDLGMLMIKGKELHVSRLSLDKGEVDVDGKIESNSLEETGGQENGIKVKIPLYHNLARPHCRMLLWEAYSKPKKWECLESAAGKICGKVVNLYPPGIPILVPGEEIEQVHINQIKEALAKEMKVQGLTEDKKICTICM